MKKVLLSILVLIYLTTSTGAAIHVHYCMGKLADWGFGHNPSKTCNKCGMVKSNEKDNGCCRDEHKFVKNDADQKKTDAGLQLMQLAGVAIKIDFIDFTAYHFADISAANPFSHAPPRTSSIAVYLRNCVFLI